MFLNPAGVLSLLFLYFHISVVALFYFFLLTILLCSPFHAIFKSTDGISSLFLGLLRFSECTGVT